MRILLAHHVPVDDTEEGCLVAAVAARLADDGQEAHLLSLEGWSLPFRLPRLQAGRVGETSFHDLGEPQIADYRDEMRRLLDDAVERVDPDVAHVSTVWVLGHLVLESGVPYVLSTWGPELSACRADARYQRFTQEAAENAGRILAPTAALADEVHATYGPLEGRVIVEPELSAARLVAHYRVAMQARGS